MYPTLARLHTKPVAQRQFQQNLIPLFLETHDSRTQKISRIPVSTAFRSLLHGCRFQYRRRHQHISPEQRIRDFPKYLFSLAIRREHPANNMQRIPRLPGIKKNTDLLLCRGMQKHTSGKQQNKHDLFPHNPISNFSSSNPPRQTIQRSPGKPYSRTSPYLLQTRKIVTRLVLYNFTLYPKSIIFPNPLYSNTSLSSSTSPVEANFNSSIPPSFPP